MKCKLLFVMLLVLGTPVITTFAAGVIQLKGTIVAFSPSEVTLEVRKSKLYIIDRTTLANSDNAKIKKSGEEVHLDVPMRSVKNVKEISTKHN
jgi:hypothetical protein